jgi:hypothetical protein
MTHKRSLVPVFSLLITALAFLGLPSQVNADFSASISYVGETGGVPVTLHNGMQMVDDMTILVTNTYVAGVLTLDIDVSTIVSGGVAAFTITDEYAGLSAAPYFYTSAFTILKGSPTISTGWDPTDSGLLTNSLATNATPSTTLTFTPTSTFSVTTTIGGGGGSFQFDDNNTITPTPAPSGIALVLSGFAMISPLLSRLGRKSRLVGSNDVAVECSI